jgi:ribonuclease D
VLIQQQENLEALCAQLNAAARDDNTPLAIDTEFISERRYSPRLCLVQVFSEIKTGAVEALIDPFAVDLKSLLAIVANPEVTKIVHAGGQDLQIFCHEYGTAAHSVFDSQIAAAFLGYGHQIGYSDLVRRLIKGLHLSKDSQYTDWATRPLSPVQMEYALNDVRYLPTIHKILQDDLKARGRLGWAEAEFRRAEVKARESLPPEEMYKKFNLAGLKRRQIGNLRELAAAREKLARALNKPPSFIASDPTLMQIAKQPPVNNAGLRSVRGISPVLLEHADKFLKALKHAAQLPDDQLPPTLDSSERPDPRTDAVAALLGVVAQARAEENDISRSYLASREQIVNLAAWWLRHGPAPDDALPDLPVLSDWRYEIVGRELIDLLRGQLGIALNPAADASILRTFSL